MSDTLVIGPWKAVTLAGAQAEQDRALSAKIEYIAHMLRDLGNQALPRHPGIRFALVTQAEALETLSAELEIDHV